MNTNLSSPSLAGRGDLIGKIILGTAYAVILVAYLVSAWPLRQSPNAIFANVLALAIAFPICLLAWFVVKRYASFLWLVLGYAMVSVGLSVLLSLLLYNGLPQVGEQIIFYCVLVALGIASILAIILYALTESYAKQLPFTPLRLLLVCTIVLCAIFIQQTRSLWQSSLQSTSAPRMTAPRQISHDVIIQAINMKRKEVSATLLTQSPQLASAAANFIHQTNGSPELFSLMSGNDTLKSTFAKNAGYPFKDIADIAATVGSSQNELTIVNHLFSNAEIRAILLDKTLSDIGISSGLVMNDSTNRDIYILIGNQKNAKASTAPTTVFVTPKPRTVPQFTGVDLFAAVNQSRKEHGVPELKQKTELCTVSSIRLNQQLAKGTIDNHEGFQGVLDQYKDQLTNYSHIAENLAEGYETAQATVKAWEGSPGHLMLLKDGSYTFGCTSANAGFAVLIAAF